MLMLSGPVELLFLADLMALVVSSSVIVMVVVGSLLIARLVSLLFWFVLCIVTFANCLLNASALSLSVIYFCY